MFTRREIGCDHRNARSYECFPLQMSIRNFLTVIIGLRRWHLVSCKYSWRRKAGRQKSACHPGKKGTPRIATSVFSLKSLKRVGHGRSYLIVHTPHHRDDTRFPRPEVDISERPMT